MILLFFSVFISEAMLSTYLSSTLDPNGSLSRARKLLPANLLFITSHCKCLLGKNYLFLVCVFLQNLCKTNKPNKKTLLSIFFKVQAQVNSYFRVWTSSRAPRSCSPWAFHQVRVVFGLQKYLGEYFIFEESFFGEYFMYIRTELELHSIFYTFLRFGTKV